MPTAETNARVLYFVSSADIVYDALARSFILAVVGFGIELGLGLARARSQDTAPGLSAFPKGFRGYGRVTQSRASSLMVVLRYLARTRAPSAFNSEIWLVHF